MVETDGAQGADWRQYPMLTQLLGDRQKLLDFQRRCEISRGQLLELSRSGSAADRGLALKAIQAYDYAADMLNTVVTACQKASQSQ